MFNLLHELLMMMMMMMGVMILSSIFIFLIFFLKNSFLLVQEQNSILGFLMHPDSRYGNFDWIYNLKPAFKLFSDFNSYHLGMMSWNWICFVCDYHSVITILAQGVGDYHFGTRSWYWIWFVYETQAYICGFVYAW